jgi:8-oxo-dGTP pyrophosphatase MutT (NUDIX family)
MAIRTKRGTAIVETEQGILVNAMPGDRFLLPGGGADWGESRIQTAIRELREETGLQAHTAVFLFSFQSRKNDHKVFYIQAAGLAQPQNEIEKIGFVRDGAIRGVFDRRGRKLNDASLSEASESTREILCLFAEYSCAHASFLEALRANASVIENLYLQHEYLPGDPIKRVK